ncbi:VpaChn25_0724 family phage protein [Shewanella algae]|uniref:VpaChn25_0724 family phage protein n=1 Tax=Shewanella algae TaxID=38313 RepID=UPI001AACF200|nr:ArsR family transcriptional regulator [Shewanella algae]MBO2611215.1 ArsR family transcriptional regulator [Shewanella algae]MBO2695526.1 ArsR family transcriptional regulator [Shewanella algae]
MALSEIMSWHQRLVILRLLAEVPGFDLNESVIQDGLDAYGLDISRDALRTQLTWLSEQGLVTINNIGKTMTATLTVRGEDVARGRATVPGIKRPRAGD